MCWLHTILQSFSNQAVWYKYKIIGIFILYKIIGFWSYRSMGQNRFPRNKLMLIEYLILSVGNIFHQWMTEIVSQTKVYTNNIFSYIDIPTTNYIMKYTTKNTSKYMQSIQKSIQQNIQIYIPTTKQIYKGQLTIIFVI